MNKLITYSFWPLSSRPPSFPGRHVRTRNWHPCQGSSFSGAGYSVHALDFHRVSFSICPFLCFTLLICHHLWQRDFYGFSSLYAHHWPLFMVEYSIRPASTGSRFWSPVSCPEQRFEIRQRAVNARGVLAGNAPEYSSYNRADYHVRHNRPAGFRRTREQPGLIFHVTNVTC
jgi:hypothetical protein